jgi:hypothetical protein
MALVPAFLRASGAFFLKRNLKEEIAPLYKVKIKIFKKKKKKNLIQLKNDFFLIFFFFFF